MDAPSDDDDLRRYRDAIAAIESEGSGDYAAIGPRTRSGDRAYGRYQVMGSNIPEWTKTATGKAATINEFRNDPELQDTVFNHYFGGSVRKYGNPQDAASVWFTGRPQATGGNASDSYITGNEYVRRFNRALGRADIARPGPPDAGGTSQRLGFSEEPAGQLSDLMAFAQQDKKKRNPSVTVTPQPDAEFRRMQDDMITHYNTPQQQSDPGFLEEQQQLADQYNPPSNRIAQGFQDLQSAPPPNMGGGTQASLLAKGKMHLIGAPPSVTVDQSFAYPRQQRGAAAAIDTSQGAAGRMPLDEIMDWAKEHPYQAGAIAAGAGAGLLGLAGGAGAVAAIPGMIGAGAGFAAKRVAWPLAKYGINKAIDFTIFKQVLRHSPEAQGYASDAIHGLRHLLGD